LPILLEATTKTDDVWHQVYRLPGFHNDAIGSFRGGSRWEYRPSPCT